MGGSSMSRKWEHSESLSILRGFYSTEDNPRQSHNYFKLLAAGPHLPYGKHITGGSQPHQLEPLEHIEVIQTWLLVL